MIDWQQELTAEDYQRFVGLFSFAQLSWDELQCTANSFAEQVNATAFTIPTLVSEHERSQIVAQLKRQEWTPVGVDGIRDHYTEDDRIGSWRVSAFDQVFAEQLYKRVRPLLSETFVDPDGKVWEPQGINPLLRFIRYKDQGVLIPHYDGSYQLSEQITTQMTLIIYLLHKGSGGRTRFLHDPQIALSPQQRDYSDWDRLADSQDVKFALQPEHGAAAVFEHRLLHDSELMSGEKILLRTDVLYSQQTD